MADLFDVAEVIGKMADGFEGEVLGALRDNQHITRDLVREQLWAGLSGDGSRLEPNYDNDPYFDETTGYWHKNNEGYKKWKSTITWGKSGWRLNLPPRQYNVPNLYIDGTFYSNITSEMNGDCLVMKPANDPTAMDIVAKWGDNILRLGIQSIEYFNKEVTEPRIWKFFEDCGW